MKPVSLIDAPVGKSEVIEMRNMHSKTYSMGSNEYRVMHSIGAYHYKNAPSDDKEQWKEIDLAWRNDHGKYVMDTAPYIVELLPGEVGFKYTSRDEGKIEVRLLKLDNISVSSLPINVLPQVNDYKILYANVLGDLSFRFDLKSAGVEMFKILTSDNASKKFEWEIIEDVKKQCSIKNITGGKDANDNPLRIDNTIEAEDLISYPGRKKYSFVEEFKDQVAIIIDPANRIKSWSDNVKYPIAIDVDASEDIVNTADDGFERTRGFSADDWKDPLTTGQFITGGQIFSISYVGRLPGFRFRTVLVPSGATINSASLKPKINTAAANLVMRFYGDNTGDAPLWGVGEYCLDITKTANFGAHTFNATGRVTIAMTAAVQSIIDNVGWSSNNDMRFAGFNYAASGTSLAKISDYIHGQANACDLAIDYTAGGAGVVPQAYMHYQQQ